MVSKDVLAITPLSNRRVGGEALVHEVKSKSYVALLVLLSLLVLLAACLLVAAQTPTPAQQQQRPRLAGSLPPPSEMAGARTSEEVSENDVVRVDTQLITVPVVVRDQEGRPVTGLTASAFQLYEDDLPQRVATFATSDAPFEVALL